MFRHVNLGRTNSLVVREDEEIGFIVTIFNLLFSIKMDSKHQLAGPCTVTGQYPAVLQDHAKVIVSVVFSYHSRNCFRTVS